MKGYKFLVPIALAVFLFASFFSLLKTKSADEKEYNSYIAAAERSYQQGIYVDAIKYYKQAIEKKPTFETYMKLGDVYNAAGKTNDAIALGETIISKYPKESAGYEYLMELLVRTGRYKEAFELKENADHRRIKSAELEKQIAGIRYKFVLTSTFDDVKAFCQGFCPVQRKGLWGAVDAKGKTAVPCKFNDTGYFNSSIAPVIDTDNSAYFIDTNGNKKRIVETGEPVRQLGVFASDMYLVYNGRVWNYYDTDCKLLFGGFDNATLIVNGVGAVENNGVWKLIDSKGNQITDRTYSDVVRDEIGIVTRNERFFVKIGLDYVMIDKNGKQYGSVYEDARLFNDGTYAAVRISDRWGFVDKDGNIVIQPVYQDALSFSNGLAAVKINGLWGYIDIDGNIAIEAQFENAKSFNDSGSAFVQQRGEWTFLSLINDNIGKRG